MGKRILIIKLASAGDVLRTAALLPGLKKSYEESYITWIVREPANELLQSNRLIDRLLVYSTESVLALLAEEFDLIISLDKAPEAAALATLIGAKSKRGFGLDTKGKIFPFNKESAYAFALGLDNRLKFNKNSKTYQQIIFEMSKLKYNGERYELNLSRKETEYGREFILRNGLAKSENIVGVNTGSGSVFANKNLRSEDTLKLISLMYKRLRSSVLLLGGPLERQMNADLARKAKGMAIDSGCYHSLMNFAGIVNSCSVLISADTLAMHIAIALRKPVIALFGPTCHQEIDLFGRGEKIVSSSKCSPCYKNKCKKSVTCMDKIDLKAVSRAVERALGKEI
jgi:heptosyltransferase-2